MKIVFRNCCIITIAYFCIVPLVHSASPQSIAAINHLQDLTKQPATQFEVLSEGAFKLGNSAKNLYEVKVYNNVTKSSSTITFDQSGNMVDRNALLSKEIAVKKSKFGSFTPALAKKLSELAAGSRIPVTIYVKDDGSDPMPRFTDEELNTLGIDEIKRRQNAWEIRKRARWLRKARLLNSGFSKLGVSVKASGDSRMMAARLSKVQLQRLKSRGDLIISEQSLPEPFLQYAAQAILADQHPKGPLTPWQYGYTGSGNLLYGFPVRVGIVDSMPVWFNSYRGSPARLKGYTRQQRDSTCRGLVVTNPVNKAYYHGTVVASAANMRTSDWLHKGLIYNGEIVSSHPCVSDGQGELVQVKAWDWARKNGATVLSYSLGTIRGGERTALAYAADDFVRNYAMTFVIAAGNLPSRSRPWVASPALAYNVVAVGASYDQNTRAWDDRMATFSSWKNPPSTHGDFEKPDLAAPGSGLLLADGKGGLAETGGTSYAAPIVAAAVGLMQESNLSHVWWPERVKAILMATAWNNVDGSAGYPSRALDYKDGAGNLVVSKMWQVSNDFRLRYSGKIKKNTRPTNRYIDINVPAMHFIRGAMAFSGGYSGYPLYDSQPAADFDIVLENLDTGRVERRSAGFDRSAEVLQHFVFSPGRYRLRLVVNRADVDTFFGMAVSVASIDELSL